VPELANGAAAPPRRFRLLPRLGASRV